MRLWPITEDVQKCMLPVGGKPMLEWWLDAVFESECFDRVYVNLHYKAADVNKWLSLYCDKNKKNVYRIDESIRLLGTAGTLFYHAEIGQSYMTAYTDMFSKAILIGGRLPRLASEWERHGGRFDAGLVPFDPPDDNSTGRIEADKDGKVIGFEEKPKHSRRLPAWSGVMFGKAESLELLNSGDKDIARDFLPKLVRKSVMLSKIDGYDIGRGQGAYESIKSSIS